MRGHYPLGVEQPDLSIYVFGKWNVEFRETTGRAAGGILRIKKSLMKIGRSFDRSPFVEVSHQARTHCLFLFSGILKSRQRNYVSELMLDKFMRAIERSRRQISCASNIKTRFLYTIHRFGIFQAFLTRYSAENLNSFVLLSEMALSRSGFVFDLQLKYSSSKLSP